MEPNSGCLRCQTANPSQIECHIAYVPPALRIQCRALWRSFGDSPPTTRCSAITLPIYRKLTDLISRRNKIDDQTTRLSMRTVSSIEPFVRVVVRRNVAAIRFRATDETKADKVSANISRYSLEERWTDIAAIRRTVKTQLPAHPRASTPDRPRPYRAVKIDNARGKSPRS